METSEKKLGCLAGTVRHNMSRCGYIEGSVNTTLKTGSKEVSIKDGKALFWIVNDYDVTVTADDIASYTIAAVNVETRKATKNVNNTKVYVYEHTVNYDIAFKNGTTGILKVKSLDVYGAGSNYKSVNQEAFRTKKCPKGYVPEVAGWLNPAGQKDEKYNDAMCPEGYTADIIGFRLLSSKAGHDSLNLVKILGLVDSPLKATVKFGNEDLPFVRV